MKLFYNALFNIKTASGDLNGIAMVFYLVVIAILTTAILDYFSKN